MNKLFLFAPLALAVLAGCANDDQPGIENTDGPVNFSASINGSSTSRAYDQTWDAGDKIGISGTSGSKAYTNVAYTTNDNQGNFTVVSEGTAIYYQTTDEVTFTAYYPWTDLSSGQTSISADTHNQNSQKSFDYLWSQKNGSKANPNVDFVFDHKMSKLLLTIKKGADVSFEEVKAVALSLTGFFNSGTFDVTTGQTATTGETSAEWTFANNTTTSDYNAPNTIDSSANTVSYTLILFPQEFSSGLTLKATNTGQSFSTNIDFTAANNSITNQNAKNELVAGRQYNLSVTLNKTALTANGCTISKWEVAEGGNFDAM